MKDFHARLIYAWHYADCDGKGVTNHSHCLVSYDRAWLDKMFALVGTTRRFQPLTTSEVKQIELEHDIARLTQKRKSLEWNDEVLERVKAA